MAKTFGTLVQKVLAEVNRENVPASGPWTAYARRALIDEWENQRATDYGFNKVTVSFTATATGTNFPLDGSGALSTRCVEIKKLWYLDDSGVVLPNDKDGVPQWSYAQLQAYLSNYEASDQEDWVMAWSVHDEKLWIAPPTDGRTIKLEALHLPNLFEYAYVSGGWKYYVNGAVQSDIDAATDTTGKWLDRATDLLCAGAIYRMLLGPAAGDEKALRRAFEAREMAASRLSRERDSLEGPVEIPRYI